MKNFYNITIRKEALKFSAAHMTVFPDGTKEQIHGHNFRTELRLIALESNLKKMVVFSEAKKIMKEICAHWDEKFLLARQCPFLKIEKETSSQLAFSLCKKSYSFPADEIVILETDNITTESLSYLFCRKFIEKYGKSSLKKASVIAVEVKIEEMLGQGSSYTFHL
jgi:6-pyruvoyltetrahydropterin/6-carboxytetrahydropterin synthase